MSESIAERPNFIEQAAEVVSAYVARNSVPIAELPNLIRSIHNTLSTLGQPAPVEPSAEPLKPAVPVKKSVTDEFIISLEDGRKFKSMKRYLSGLGMTPEQYRTKWSLAKDYPMVAPAYAAKRSALAKTIGLGRKAAEAAPVTAPQPEPETAAPAPKRGRAKKAA